MLHKEKKPTPRKRARRFCDSAAKLLAFLAVMCAFGLKHNLKFWLAAGAILLLGALFATFLSGLIDPLDPCDEHDDDDTHGIWLRHREL